MSLAKNAKNAKNYFIKSFFSLRSLRALRDILLPIFISRKERKELFYKKLFFFALSAYFARHFTAYFR
ncbi:MAG: hypothetical protein BWK80_22995 [Desulfobacteraceae bacterium IS3]|nr:MAG: hypothetical protein BWK80_22995 [Desulfobacteraceae bacterium IS3]